MFKEAIAVEPLEEQLRRRALRAFWKPPAGERSVIQQQALMNWRDRSPLLIAGICLALGLIILWPIATAYIREFRLVDRCLDRGGSFDYAGMRCDHNEAHAYIPFTSRHEGLGTRISVGTVLLAAAILTPMVGTVARRQRSRPAV